MIQRFMEGHDIFVSLPTGSGKSLCYWSLPGAFDYMKDNHHASSIVIVVSPLTALMKDQVKSLCKKGVKAIHVDAPNDNVLKEIHQGVYQLLFFGPEELLCNLEWRDMLLSTVYTSNLVGFIIDEAHCVKKWYVFGEHMHSYNYNYYTLNNLYITYTIIINKMFFFLFVCVGGNSSERSLVTLAR